GNAHQFAVNTICAVAAMVFSFVMTYGIAIVIDRTLGMRVTEDEEYVGLDICQHGERA
ncbi:MAG: ammonium transporter, partial [Methanoregula sp.]|nr:ammonium transporter [Methanoregula sp.]